VEAETKSNDDKNVREKILIEIESEKHLNVELQYQQKWHTELGF
jgi:hypothetical protein